MKLFLVSLYISYKILKNINNILKIDFVYHMKVPYHHMVHALICNVYFHCCYGNDEWYYVLRLYTDETFGHKDPI